MPVLRDDGSTDWRTLARWVALAASAVVLTVLVYLAVAWSLVMNTSWCPSPWSRLDDASDTCVSPM